MVTPYDFSRRRPFFRCLGAFESPAGLAIPSSFLVLLDRPRSMERLDYEDADEDEDGF